MWESEDGVQCDGSGCHTTTALSEPQQLLLPSQDWAQQFSNIEQEKDGKVLHFPEDINTKALNSY